MSDRKPLKVSGLLQSGKVTVNPNIDAITDFGTLGVDDAQDKLPAPNANASTELPLTLIDDSPYQPRMMYDPAEIDNLAHSLAAAGIEDAITVRQVGARYELISGHRRVRAARSLGWVNIAAQIVTKDDRQAELATMVQNEARVDLTDYERAKLYQAAIASGFGKTQTDISNLFGCSQARVSKCLSMLKLPSSYQKMLNTTPNLFGANCAETVLLLMKEYPAEHALIEDAVNRIAQEGADQKSVRQWVQQMVKQKEGQSKTNERAVVTNQAGREIFVVKPSSRDIWVQYKGAEIDRQVIQDAIMATLRKLAETPQE